MTRKEQRQQIEVTSRKLAKKGGRLGAWVSFCFRGFFLSGKLTVIHVEDHAADYRMARQIIRIESRIRIEIPSKLIPAYRRTAVRINIYIYIYIYYLPSDNVQGVIHSK